MARIIIAEDDELVVEVVRTALAAHGHVVGALPDGASVREVADFKQPDLIILDCGLPHVSGVKALTELRTSRLSHDIPVLMLTGRRSQQDEDIAFRAGADDYLRKPFDPEQLVSRVELLLARRKDQQA